MKARRNVVFAFTLTLIGAISMTNSAVAQGQAPLAPTTTGVMVILTAKAGVAREQVMAGMPGGNRGARELYLNGKIWEGDSAGDGRRAPFLLVTTAGAEAD